MVQGEMAGMLIGRIYMHWIYAITWVILIALVRVVRIDSRDVTWL